MKRGFSPRTLLLATMLSLSSLSALASSPGPIRPLAPKAVQSYMQLDPVDVSNPFEAESLIAALESVASHGLDPDDYHLQLIREKGVDGEMAIYALDGWMSAASHIAFGKVSPTSVEPDWTAKGRQADLVAHLQESLANGTMADSLNQLAPQHRAYQSLRQGLVQRQAQAANPVQIVSAGETLRVGMSGTRVSQLQARLGLEATGRFDEQTEDAVMLFQADAGLDDDGIVGPATIRALNRGPQDEINQLRVNLERWRWLPDDLGEKHVRVNIADFSVQAWRNGQVEQVFGAIVGKTYRKTPVFSDQIEYVVLNPWWETPASLARRDKLPQFKRDPAAVSRLGFQVLDNGGQVVNASTIDWNSIPAGTMPYRLRQAPGPLNALGQVKIMFPNQHNVYLHDTPDRGLFAQRQRAFSSGCIRTQNPIELTEWLMNDTPTWNRERINAALDSGRETRAELAARIPVHILYMTAVTDEAGVRFVDDIYERDAAVLAGLMRDPKT